MAFPVATITRPGAIVTSSLPLRGSFFALALALCPCSPSRLARFPHQPARRRPPMPLRRVALHPARLTTTVKLTRKPSAPRSVASTAPLRTESAVCFGWALAFVELPRAVGACRDLRRAHLPALQRPRGPPLALGLPHRDPGALRARLLYRKVLSRSRCPSSPAPRRRARRNDHLARGAVPPREVRARCGSDHHPNRLPPHRRGLLYGARRPAASARALSLPREGDVDLDLPPIHRPPRQAAQHDRPACSPQACRDGIS